MNEGQSSKKKLILGRTSSLLLYGTSNSTSNSFPSFSCGFCLSWLFCGVTRILPPMMYAERTAIFRWCAGKKIPKEKSQEKEKRKRKKNGWRWCQQRRRQDEWRAVPRRITDGWPVSHNAPQRPRRDGEVRMHDAVMTVTFPLSFVVHDNKRPRKW